MSTSVKVWLRVHPITLRSNERISRASFFAMEPSCILAVAGIDAPQRQRRRMFNSTALQARFASPGGQLAPRCARGSRAESRPGKLADGRVQPIAAR
jgi:hypothetical protein